MGTDQSRAYSLVGLGVVLAVLAGCAPDQLSPNSRVRYNTLRDSNSADDTYVDPDAGPPADASQAVADPLAPRCVNPGEIFGIYTGGVVCPAGLWAVCQGQQVECSTECDQLVFGASPEQTTSGGKGYCCYGRNAVPEDLSAAQCLRADLTPRCRLEQADGTFTSLEVPVVCLPAPQPTATPQMPPGM